MKLRSILLTVVISLLFSLSTKAQTDSIISTLVNVHQGNGAGLATRTVIDTFILPHDISSYDSIQMHVLLNCPSGGCDPWDRFANILVYHDTDWYEIGRYMTPYGISCGWWIDVSDYRDFLHDTVIIKSFIDTWTNPGWLVNIDFKFKAGIPSHQYIKIENLWSKYNIVYGDSTQPIDIPDVYRFIDDQATNVKVKIINTGHGQGNTGNAAEFSQKTHHIIVNGTQTFNQLLWRTNCSTNPCSPQNGNWQYNRANWCPGADVVPSIYDITSYISPGGPVTIRYELQSYFNYCSPHNTACVQGTTCTDCNYNYNGHTEPYYMIAGQMISYLSTPAGIRNISADKFSISPNPSPGLFTIHLNKNSTLLNAEIFSTEGKLMWSGEMNGNEQQFDLHFLNKGVYMMRLKNSSFNSTQKLIIN